MKLRLLLPLLVALLATATSAFSTADSGDEGIDGAAIRAIATWCDAVVAHDVAKLDSLAPPRLAEESVDSWKRYTRGVVASIKDHGPCDWRLNLISWDADEVKFEVIYMTKSHPYLAGKMLHFAIRDGETWHISTSRRF